MPYVPNADDSTNPTDAILAETAQAEFRALKVKINTMIGLSTSGQSLAAIYTLVAALTATEAADIANLTAQLAGKAPIANPAFVGIPTGPVAAAADNSNQLATTSWVQIYLLNLPQASTAAAGDISQRIATTAFTANAIASAAITGQPFTQKVTISGLYVAGLNYLVDTQATIGLVFQLVAAPTAQSFYKFTDPTNSWGLNPWTLGSVTDNFYTPYTGVVAGPVTVNFPDSEFSISWNVTQNAWEFV